MRSMPVVRQLSWFGVVGICATLIHVGAAWMMVTQLGAGGLLANGVGATAAFAVSYLGNATLTFANGHRRTDSAPRYLLVTVASFLMTSAIMALVQRNGLPMSAYAIIVICTVPPSTFLLAKFWAFRPRPQRS